MSSADANNGDNDLNADDAVDIDDIDDRNDIGEDDDPNTHSSHTNITITVHGGGPQTKKGKHFTTEPFFSDSIGIVILNIHVQ